ncbi:MAG: M18 family aminopeptidase [Methylomonas sp.]|nr:MAG: M18 family aminopeptidase [Methylomonas sp.]PPD26116.1 MAG: M18 family aminopeptidase [Methylomonas sp.]PPD37832.1 MAG: M18 family aminopeptidase [Methylomonas sp.]PPD38628.1 MAG: M18 family aminopeptidase [Methylomonas sp.]PPD55347.1 MAG: M18 family aminopeptidase [Methylomonas sp.]
MTPRQQVQSLLDFIDASPSPWHVVETLAQRLNACGFRRLAENQVWSLDASGRYYVVRDDSSIIAFATGQNPLPSSGFKIIAAHTDSPGLRVKPNPCMASDNLLRLAVEVYGGPILATFSDRDLGLAGRIAYKATDGSLASRLLRSAEPLLRLPNLAIHMNRSVNEDGLKFNKQTELPLLFAASDSLADGERFASWLQSASDLSPEQILGWELSVYDTQKGGFWGDDQAFYANGQIDNLASCHAGLSALLAASEQETTTNTLVCAFFDHEEIGSESLKGAAGSFLPDVLQRIADGMDCKSGDYTRALANSLMISTDMAHAYQPNFPNAYESNHKIIVNQGPVVKINHNHRYASTCLSEALFVDICQEIGVPLQKYVHRGDLACGSTLGPIASARLGIKTVDVGNPMWAMHSARESAGVDDHAYMIRALSHFFAR